MYNYLGHSSYYQERMGVAHCCALFLGHLGIEMMIDKSKYQREIIWLGNQLGWSGHLSASQSSNEHHLMIQVSRICYFPWSC